MKLRKKIIVDGRVFSSEAHDRGMGRYVQFLIKIIAASGFEICLILYKNSRLREDDPLRSLLSKIEYIDIDPAVHCEQDIHTSSYEIETIIKRNNGVVFIDATPFLLPKRLDITACAIIAVVYDLIPLKHPKDYISDTTIQDLYRDGLRRLITADYLLAISDQSKEDVVRYLGIDTERIEVIYPCLDEQYLTRIRVKEKSKDFFSIVGGHCSKNPEFSFTLFNRLNALKKRNFTVCVPTQGQLSILKGEFSQLIKPLSLQSSLSEKDKVTYQAEANAVFHLSRDEGFGIPLLEALFMHTKAVCCDIKVNREILEKGGPKWDQFALLITTQIEEVDLSKIADFIDQPMPDDSSQYYETLKNYFLFHWETEAIEVMKRATKRADEVHKTFLENTIAKMACNLPADFCGVADYAYSIPRGTEKNILIYTADLKLQNFDILENVRIKSHLCFFHDLEKDLPTIFHLAISERLWFGVELLRLYGTSKDIVILHDHVYLYGLYSFYLCYKDLNQFLEAYFVGSDLLLKDRFVHTKQMNFDEFQTILKDYSSEWLRQKNACLISHLTENAEKEHSLYSNTISLLDKKYVEIGIDDKATPAVLKTGKSWRRQKGILSSDFLVGTFGSITDNKLLFHVATSVSKAGKIIQSKWPGLKMHFIVCGKVHDFSLFKQMKDLFLKEELDDLFHFENPQSDQVFDGMMCAADLVISCRKQNRGQLSHIIPRALSLGKPIITNTKSGYTMISNDFMVDDEGFEEKLTEKLCYLFQNRESLDSASLYNHQLFMDKHNIGHFFNQIISQQTESIA